MIKTNGLMHPKKNAGETTFYVEYGNRTVQVNLKPEMLDISHKVNIVYINGIRAFDSVAGESDISIRNRVKQYVSNSK